MKILYDSQIFEIQKFGGISRYFNTLCNYRADFFNFELSGKYSDNVYAQNLSNMKPFPVKQYFRGKGRIIHFVNSQVDKNLINTGKYDIFHPTYYFISKYPKQKPVVITAHDFIHELFPRNFSQKDKTINAKCISLHKADRIIAISETTKRDLLRFYPDIKEDKIDVVYHAIEWKKRKKQELSLNIKKQYILYTGTRNSYKNFELFIKSCAPLLIEYDLLLICTGSKFSEMEFGLMQSLKIENRCYCVFASENQLRELYENALMFVFPSIYEGFGMPILESFISGCPTLLANASCFPEIASNAALFFDPKSIEDMRNQMLKVIQSESLRDNLIQKGLSRFEFFSMEKFINGTYRTYEKVLSEY